MNSLLDTEQLYEWCGCKQKRRLERWLRLNGIKYWLSANGTPITTVQAINDSVSINHHSDDFIFE